MALIALEDVTFRYPEAPRPALADVTLSVESGTFSLVISPSGGGKTTLLRLLKSVMTPHGHLDGRVLFDGRPLADVPEREQAARLGFVMQNPDAQIVTDSVWHELAFGLESLGFSQPTMHRRVAEMASFFGIQPWFHKKVDELSGGQKQLLNLASVMALQPDVLVLDEPTSQLDPIAAIEFLNAVERINRELGVTVVMTEHRLEEVYHLADSVVVLDAGALVACGSPREVAARLYAEESPMTLALPSPVRIYYGVEGVAASEGYLSVCAGESVGSAAGKGDGEASVPLTVREGRAWLAAEVAANPPSKRSLPLEEGAPRQGRPAQPAAQIKDVWFRYTRDGADVLRGLSLSVAQGELLALVGGNGAGKSTLLRVLCGTARPFRGKVRVFGDTSFAEVAMLPQDPLNLMAKTTVRGDLEEMLPRSLAPDKRAQAIADVARTTDIARLLDAHPFDLSGGELQRAALAKVLLCEPRLLLLDEPTKGLDAAHKESMAAVIAALVAQGVTVVLVSHDIEFCAAHADRVGLLFDGEVVSTGTPREFFASNSFYTTAANRLSRGIFENAVTDQEVIQRCTT